LLAKIKNDIEANFYISKNLNKFYFEEISHSSLNQEEKHIIVLPEQLAELLHDNNVSLQSSIVIGIRRIA
jgi:hypothetical protein